MMAFWNKKKDVIVDTSPIYKNDIQEYYQYLGQSFKGYLGGGYDGDVCMITSVMYCFIKKSDKRPVYDVCFGVGGLPWVIQADDFLKRMKPLENKPKESE